MNFEEVKGYFGSVEKARVALGLKSRQTLYNWRDGGIPDDTQCRIELLTANKLGVNGHPPLKADAESIRKVA